MTPHDSPAGLRVSADLSISVTAPDGSAARITVTDQSGELVVDVDQPLVALKALPATADLRVLARGLGVAVGRRRPAASVLPPIRLRTRGVTVAVARHGRARPSSAVTAGVAMAVVATAALLFAAARRLTTALRRSPAT